MEVDLVEVGIGSESEAEREAHLCVGVVAPPIWTNTRLTAKIPDLKVDVFVRDRLDIESDCLTIQPRRKASSPWKQSKTPASSSLGMVDTTSPI